MKLAATVANFLRNAEQKVKSFFTPGEDNLMTDDRGEAYIGEAIKILIAVVIGALLLALAYALLKNTVFPTVTTKIQEMFNYTA